MFISLCAKAYCFGIGHGRLPRPPAQVTLWRLKNGYLSPRVQPSVIVAMLGGINLSFQPPLQARQPRPKVHAALFFYRIFENMLPFNLPDIC